MFDSREELLRKIRLAEDTSPELKTVAFKGDRILGPRREAFAQRYRRIASGGLNV